MSRCGQNGFSQKLPASGSHVRPAGSQHVVPKDQYPSDVIAANALPGATNDISNLSLWGHPYDNMIVPKDILKTAGIPGFLWHQLSMIPP